MIFVCDEYQQQAKWFFDEETNVFHKIWNHGAPDKRIKGEYLPDPSGIRLEGREPSPVTVKLWDFWQARNA